MATTQDSGSAKAESEKKVATPEQMLCPACAGFGHFAAAKKGGKQTTCPTCHGSGMVAKPSGRPPRATRSSSSRGAKKRAHKAAAKSPAKTAAKSE